VAATAAGTGAVTLSAHELEAAVAGQNSASAAKAAE